MTEYLRQRLLSAIALEHTLHEEAERCERLAKRWQRRVELALRVGDEEMVSAAIERKNQAIRNAEAFRKQYMSQMAAVRALKARSKRFPLPLSTRDPSVENRLEKLAREERLERDLQSLKRQLAAREAPR